MSEYLSLILRTTQHPHKWCLTGCQQEDKMCAHVSTLMWRGSETPMLAHQRWKKGLGFRPEEVFLTVGLCIGAFRKETMRRLSGACVKYSRPTYCSTSFARPESESCAQAPGFTDQKAQK